MKKSIKKSTAKKASAKARKVTSKKSTKKIISEVQPEESEELYVQGSTEGITTTDEQELKNLKSFEELDFFLSSLRNSGKKLVAKSGGYELTADYSKLPDTLTYNNGKQMARVQALSKYFTIE